MNLSIKVAIIVTATSIAINYPGIPAHADNVRDAQWHLQYLNISRAHQLTKGQGITVAVVDSGVSPHADLTDNLKRGEDTAAGGDGIGQSDESGHGTAMAGLIAGHGHGDNSGIMGIAPNAGILPIRALSANDSGNTIELGIKRAAELKASIISISAGTPRSRPLTEAIAAAVSSDSVIVAASGNSSQTPRLGYPAALPEVLAVGAVGKNGKIADFSVRGSKIGICAPGVDIATTDRENKYSQGRGTSQAAAIVSGAAALVRARFPGLSASEVVHRLTATADDNGPPGKDDECGYGVLNIVKALTADVPPLTPGGVGSGSSSAQPGGGVTSGAPGGVSAGVPSAGALPESESSGVNLPAIVGGGALVAVLVGLLALVTVRRRRSSS